MISLIQIVNRLITAAKVKKYKTKFIEEKMFGCKKLFSLLLLFLLGSLPFCTTIHDNIFQKQLFDLNWRFSKGDYKNAYETAFNDINWRSIDLPHNWSSDTVLTHLLKQAETDSKTTETGWYRKSFEIPENWAGKKFLIEFEGISAQHEIFVNGVSVNSSENEQLHTQADLTSNLHPKGNNLIAIRVEINNESVSAKNAESGIFSHVWLVVKDKTQNP